jgi:hypothetical protein
MKKFFLLFYILAVLVGNAQETQNTTKLWTKKKSFFAF